MKRYGVIMAGGGGTRFWPLSRQELPKQFLNLTGDDLMVNETVNRLQPSIEPKDIFIVTNVTQAALMHNVTSGIIAEDHILSEPAARNTAACIGYAAVNILKKYGDGIMCVFASDHHIKNKELFNDTLQQAIGLAEETGKLITIGIEPSFPATGYGYIKYDKAEIAFREQNSQPAYAKVQEFVEKPDVLTARAYLKEGGFLWNSGMFVWKVSAILEQFRLLLPDVYACLQEMEAHMGTRREWENIQKVYPTIPKISIDYGIMERAKGVLVVKGKFDWSDVGSWDALEALHDKDEYGNVTNREQILINTNNCIVYAKSKLIATLGVDDLIIVEAEDAILVCHKDKAQSVREIPDELKKQGREEYL